MGHTSIDIYLVIDTFLLLLIGVGPKIALVPFLEITAAIDPGAKALVVRKMLTTAAVVAVMLVVLGEPLARLLHFSTGSLSIAGGVILIIIAVTMVLGSADPSQSAAVEGREPAEVAAHVEITTPQSARVGPYNKRPPIAVDGRAKLG